MKPLTFVNTAQGIAIIDMCPTPLAANDDLLLFTRTPDQGATTYLAVVSISTGNVTMLEQLPQQAPTSGCPNFVETPDGLTVIYMACYGEDCGFSAEARVVLPVRRYRDLGAASGPHWAAWGTTPPPRARDQRAPASGFAYVSVTAAAGDPTSWTAKHWFDVPLTNTSDTIDSYAVTQCDQIHGLPGVSPITCQGASVQYSPFQMLFVDPTTGNSTVNSYNTFQACLTPKCSTMMATY